MKHEDQDRIELAEYARILWKRKWMIIVPTVLVVATAWIGLSFVTPVYVSSALIQILDTDVVESAAADFAGERRSGRHDDTRDRERQMVGKLNQEVTSQRFLAPVGRRLGLDQDTGVRQSAANLKARLPDLALEELIVFAYTARLKEKIAVEPAGIAQYKFSCKDEDPAFAYALAKAVSDEYLDFTLNQGIEVVDRTQQFSNEQLERYQKLLTEAENALEAKQREISSRALWSQNPVSEGNLAETRGLIDQADLEIASLERRIQRGLERLPAAIGGLGAIESAVTSGRLASLTAALAQAERNQVPIIVQGLGAGSMSNEAGSEVTRTRTELFAEIQARVEQAFPQAAPADQKQMRDIVYDRITLRSVAARKARIQELLSQYSSGVVSAPEQQLELSRLQQEVDRYRTLVDNIQERRIADGLQRTAQEASVSARVKIIEQPAVPVKPAWPDRVRVLLLALIAGPLLGLGAIVLAEYMDTSLRTVEEIEQELALPVLGAVPRLVPANLRAGRRRHGRRSAVAAGERP
jgi:uncharacterized protein involved in exopolysaccharide biosynthesis